MKILTIIALFSSCFFVTALRKKPLCKMCENFVKEVDTVVKKEGDVAAVLEKFCHNVLSFLTETCQKMILKNLKSIIERLQAHERAEKICIDLHYCANHTSSCT